MARTGYITGVEDIDRNLAALSDTAEKRIVKSAMRSGAAEVAKAEKQLAPRGPTGNLQAAIGFRLVKVRGASGRVQAKAGIDVGRRVVGKNVATGKRIWNRAGGPHAHLVALGTQVRYRKVIGGKFAVMGPVQQRKLTTGRMPANDFIRRAREVSSASALFVIKDQIVKGIAKEVNRLGRKSGRTVGGVF